MATDDPRTRNAAPSVVSARSDQRPRSRNAPRAAPISDSDLAHLIAVMGTEQSLEHWKPELLSALVELKHLRSVNANRAAGTAKAAAKRLSDTLPLSLLSMQKNL
jgi:hypothetical protein